VHITSNTGKTMHKFAAKRGLTYTISTRARQRKPPAQLAQIRENKGTEVNLKRDTRGRGTTSVANADWDEKRAIEEFKKTLHIPSPKPRRDSRF
jgi:hypothetical protein